MLNANETLDAGNKVTCQSLIGPTAEVAADSNVVDQPTDMDTSGNNVLEFIRPAGAPTTFMHGCRPVIHEKNAKEHYLGP